MTAEHPFTRVIGRLFSRSLGVFGYKIVRDMPLIAVHDYQSYEEYRAVQIYHNKRKIDRVWADDATLQAVADRILREAGPSCSSLRGLCHGSRNGYEVRLLAELLNKAAPAVRVAVIGTDISGTATEHGLTQWDFHDAKPEFINSFDFIYSNSLDQSWKPKEALSVWLGQLVDGGLLFIEHTRRHGVQEVGEMDPFGVQAEYMPYVLADWFGHRISIEIMKTVKRNNDLECWVFVVRKRN